MNVSGGTAQRWYPVIMHAQRGYRWDCRLCHEFGEWYGEAGPAERGGFYHEQALIHQLLLERYDDAG